MDVNIVASGTRSDQKEPSPRILFRGVCVDSRQLKLQLQSWMLGWQLGFNFECRGRYDCWGRMFPSMYMLTAYTTASECCFCVLTSIVVLDRLKEPTHICYPNKYCFEIIKLYHCTDMIFTSSCKWFTGDMRRHLVAYH